MFRSIKTVKRIIKCGCHTATSYKTDDTSVNFVKHSHKKKETVNHKSVQHLQSSESCTPQQFLEECKRSHMNNSLYLVDSKLAAEIGKHILSAISPYKDVLICEANPGLGHLTSHLIEGGIRKIHLYEGCLVFKKILQDLAKRYPERIQLFTKDVYQIWKLSFMDKQDKGERVKQFLKDVPRKDWTDDPSLVIVGTMPTLNFMNYLMKVIAFQSELVTYGRTELYVVIRPGDYLKLTGGPHLDLHTYQSSSILYNTFCKTTLLTKLPRTAFAPKAAKITTYSRTIRKYDSDHLYLVQIELNKVHSLNPQQYLPYYYFTKQFFKKGNVRVIPKLEEWIPDIGFSLIASSSLYNLNKDINIYTKTGELTPSEILNIFQIFYNHPGYANSSFTALVDAELLKTETVETDMEEVNKQKPQ